MQAGPEWPQANAPGFTRRRWTQVQTVVLQSFVVVVGTPAKVWCLRGLLGQEAAGGAAGPQTRSEFAANTALMYAAADQPGATDRQQQQQQQHAAAEEEGACSSRRARHPPALIRKLAPAEKNPNNTISPFMHRRL